MDGRAQTTIDFAIAMGVFMVALTTVVAFMPTMTQPFTGGQENPLAADRIAAQLTDGQLGDPATPSQLNTTCTMHFFNESNDPSGDNPCPSFDPTADLTDRLGVDENTFVNVTIRKDVTGGADPETVCATPGADDLNDPATGCSGTDTLMAVGPTAPGVSGSVTIARRLARLEGKQVYLVVRVWT